MTLLHLELFPISEMKLLHENTNRYIVEVSEGFKIK
jgi:hypothetical protein